MRASISLACVGDQPDERAADVAAAEDPDADVLVVPRPVRLRGSVRELAPSAFDGHSSQLAGIVGQRHGVAEVDAHVAGREDRVAVERHGLQPARRLGERHVAARSAGRGRPSRRSRPPPGPHRGGAEAQAEQAVERRRRAAAEQVPEHDGAGFLAGELLEALGDDRRRCRRASRPARRPCRAPTPCRPSAPRPRRRRRSRTWRRAARAGRSSRRPARARTGSPG